MATKKRRIVPEPMPGWTRPGHAFGRRILLRRWPILLMTAAVLAASVLVAARVDPLPSRFTGAGRASDGDSLRLGADRLRLVGLDAPELDQICWRSDGAEWPCGREARNHMAALLGEGSIACTTAGGDQFGRFLATCTTEAGENIGASIVEAGLAVARDDFFAEQSAAQSAKRGLWTGRFTDPRTWRDEGPANDPGPDLFETIWNWLRS